MSISIKLDGTVFKHVVKPILPPDLVLPNKDEVRGEWFFGSGITATPFANTVDGSNLTIIGSPNVSDNYVTINVNDRFRFYSSRQTEDINKPYTFIWLVRRLGGNTKNTYGGFYARMPVESDIRYTGIFTLSSSTRMYGRGRISAQGAHASYGKEGEWVLFVGTAEPGQKSEIYKKTKIESLYAQSEDVAEEFTQPLGGYFEFGEQATELDTADIAYAAILDGKVTSDEVDTIYNNLKALYSDLGI